MAAGRIQLTRPRWVAVRELYEDWNVPLDLLAGATETMEASILKVADKHGWCRSATVVETNRLRARMMRLVRQKADALDDDGDFDAISKTVSAMARLVDGLHRLLADRPNAELEAEAADDASLAKLDREALEAAVRRRRQADGA